ncbi:MAG: hypothetical protein ABSG87_10380 [Verrucomicrobiota bacterium]|jgi:hypothetical protein
MGLKSPAGMVMIERATGKMVGPIIPFKRGDFFYKIPKFDLRIWHYMEFWKFENLINEKCLYFRRSDKLDDDMEGKYAEANRNYTTAMYERFLKAYPIQDNHEHRETGNEAFRHAVFINCWHLNRVENMAMWERFTKTENSVVLRTTVRRLFQSVSELNPNTNKMELKPIVSKVSYAPQTIPRPEWSHYGPYFYKDTKFMDEREFRLIIHPPENHAIGEEDVAQKLSIDPVALIEQIIIHPRSPADFRNKIKDFLQTKGIRIPSSKSALARSTI